MKKMLPLWTIVKFLFWTIVKFLCALGLAGALLYAATRIVRLAWGGP